MDAFQNWLAQLQLDKLWVLLVTVASALLCITVHESCHGLAAWAMGDTTAKRAGRLSLNPLKHIDPVGLVMMAVAGFGWAKPVPVNMRNFRNPKKGMALTALAGPVSNLLLGWIALMLDYFTAFFYIRNGGEWLYYVNQFFWYTANLSIGLAVFNLIPVPPLDGSKVLFAVIPNEWYYKLMRYERYGMIALAVLLLSGVLDTPLLTARQWMIELLDPVSRWPFELLVKIYF